MTILELLDAPGIRSTRQIADALGTSVEMAEARLEHYARLGYLKKTVFSPHCGGACQNCPRCGGRGEGHSAPIVCWEKSPSPSRPCRTMSCKAASPRGPVRPTPSPAAMDRP